MILNLFKMFGTEKDVNGNNVFTFLGEKGFTAKDNIDNIIGAITDLKGKLNEPMSVNDSLGVWGAFLLGNQKQDYDFSSSFKDDYLGLLEYIHQIKDVNKTAEEAFTIVQGKFANTSVQFEEFIKKMELTNKTVNEAAAEYIPAFIKSVTNATTVTQFFGNVAVKAIGTLKNIAIAAAAAAAIDAVMKLTSAVKDYAKENTKAGDGSHFFYSMKELTENAKDSGAEVDNLVSSIDDYKDSITDLKVSLDSGTLSESEAYDAKKKLISIQDELVDKYGNEVSGIDLVNGSLETQIALLDEAEKRKARVWLNDPDNNKAINEAQKNLTVNGVYDTDNTKYDLRATTDEWNQIQEIANKNGLGLTSATDKNGNISFSIHLTADATDAEESYNNFINEVSSNNQISDSLKNDLDRATSDVISKASAVISENEELANQAAKYQIQTNDAWNEIYSNLEKAQSDFNDAVAKGDDTLITKAVQEAKAARDAYYSDNTGFKESYAGSAYTENLIKQIDESTRLEATQRGLSEAWSNYAGYANEAADAVNNLTDAEKKYGNIDNVNRNIISWNSETIEKYGDALDSWSNKFGDLRNNLDGTWSTVLGDVDTTKNWMGVQDDVSFTYTMFFEDGGKLVPLNQQNFRSYMANIINHATDGNGKINPDKLVALDSNGLDMEIDGEVKHISNMLAAVEGATEDGVVTSLGDVHAIAGKTAKELEEMALSSEYAGRGMHQLHEQTRIAEAALDDPEAFGILDDLAEYLDMDKQSAKDMFKTFVEGTEEISGLKDIDLLNLDSLEGAGSLTAENATYTEQQIDGYRKLNQAAKDLNITMPELIDILVKIGVVTSDNIKYTNDFTQQAITKSSSAVKAIASVKSALSSQTTGTGVDTDTYSELIKDNAEYAAALEYSNGTMQLNREMTESLTEAKVKESAAYIETAYSQNQLKYEKVKNDLAQYTDEVRNNSDMTTEQIEQFDKEKAALESQSEALRENCRNLQMQYTALMQASSAYQDWVNAQNATESGDMYDSAIDAKKALAEGLKNGKIGTVKWQAASDFLIPDDWQGTAAQYIKKLNRYFKQKTDGSDDGSGINNFITDSLKAGLMKQESDGSIKILADKTTEDFAKALKLSPDAVQSIFGEMQEYGWQFDWGSMLGNPITNYKMQIDNLKDTLDDLDPNSNAWEVVNAQVQELESALDGLYQRSGLDQLANVVQQAKDDGIELNEDAQKAAEALDTAARVQNELDIYDAQQAVNEAQKNFTDSGKIEDLDKLNAANKALTEYIQKRGQAGTPTEIEVETYLRQHADADGNVATETIDKMQKAGLIKVDAEMDGDFGEQITTTYDAAKSHVEKPITITANATQCMTTLNNIITQLNKLPSTHVITVSVKQNTVKTARTQTYAEKVGGAGAFGGAFAGGRTLVGELGNELVVNPHSGKWYTVGDKGAEFVNLPKDAIVFDHDKTKRLLDQGFIGGRGVALVSGNAMDSGSPGIGSYVGGSGYKVGQDPRVKSTYKATTDSTKATKDNTKALEENKKALEKQKKALEKQKDALEKESNKLKIYGQAALNEIEKRINALNKEKEAQDKAYESQIKELEKKKTALQKANDEEDRAIKLAELQDALAKAKAQRTVRVYTKNEGFVWRADQSAVDDAQNNLDEQKRTWKNDDVLQAVDDEIERINNLKDAYDESIESQIDNLNDLKDKWNEIISLIGTDWDDYQAQLEAAALFNSMSLDGMAGALDGYKDNVIANMKAIGETSAEIDKVTDAIDALEEASSSSSGSGDTDPSAGFGMDDGSGVSLLDGLTDSAKAAQEELDKLVEEYKKLGDQNEELSGKQLEMVDSISKLNVGTEEYKTANEELTNAQQTVGERYSEMSALAEQYREKVLSNTDLTAEQKTTMLDSFDEIVDSYSTGYDTITGLMQNYMDTLVNDTSLTQEELQTQVDSFITFAEQHGITYDDLITQIVNYELELQAGGATAEEVSAQMDAFVKAACDSMNTSYQSTIDKINALKQAQQELANMPHVQTSRGEQVVSAGNGYAGRYMEYASGVLNAATTHIAITDEQGPEIKLRKPAAGNYSLVERGTSIIPAEPSANIWKMGLDPEQFISQHMPQRSIKSVEITQPNAGGVSVSVGDIQMYGVNDVESFGRVIHERVGTIFAQEFSRH